MVKSVKSRLLSSFVLVAIAAALTAWFVWNGMETSAVLLGGVCLTAILFVCKSYCIFLDAKLICESAILTVPSAVVSNLDGSMEESVAETVISTFGILVDDRVINWGKDGIRGIKLVDVRMDSTYITFVFGDRQSKRKITLPHGLTDADVMHKVNNQLHYETGVEVKMDALNRKMEELK